MYFASQLDFFSKFLIIIKSPILYCSMSSYVYLFCLECASFILRAANMYVCLNLSSQVMPLYEPKYLSFCCKRLQGKVNMGCIQSVKGGEIPGNVHWGTRWMQQLHVEVVHPILGYCLS